MNNQLSLSDGRQLSYYQYGAPKGRVMLNCHGGLVNGQDIAWLHAAAKVAGVRIISPNRPGLDGSSPQPSRSLKSWAADVNELTKCLGITKFAVCGWSMGGQYAAACAALLPKQVSQLVIVAGCLPLNESQNLPKLNRMDRRFIGLSTHHPVVARVSFGGMGRLAQYFPQTYRRLAARSLPGADRAVVTAEPVEYFSQPAAKALINTHAMVEEYRVFADPWGFELNQIACPTAIWQGQQDNLVPSAWAKAWHRQIRSSKLHLLPGGHFVAHGHAGEVLASVA